MNKTNYMLMCGSILIVGCLIGYIVDSIEWLIVAIGTFWLGMCVIAGFDLLIEDSPSGDIKNDEKEDMPQ